MQPVQLILFSDGTEAVQHHAPRNTAHDFLLPEQSDNVLIQELMDAGAWSDIARLEDARDSYRREVIECKFTQDEFIAHEYKVALQLTAERLRSLTLG
jgi:hypothetical protein